MENYIPEEIKIKDKLSLQITSNTEYLNSIKKEFDLFNNPNYLKALTDENLPGLQRFDNINIEIRNLKALIDGVKAEIVDFSREYIPNKKEGIFSRWFTSEKDKRALKREAINKFRQEKGLRQFEMRYESVSIEARNLLEKIDNYTTIKAKCEQFEPNSYKLKISRAETKIDELLTKWNEIVVLENEINYALGEDIDALNKLIADFKTIEAYKEDLNDSEESYDRKLIHDELEERFGDGNPRRLSSSIHKKIISKKTYIDRHIIKIRERASFDLQNKRKRNNCKKLFIDGNNLCYRENEFVGLKPLENLIRAVHDTYEIVLIFDSIFSVKTDIRDLKQKFPDNVEVVIPEFKQSADLLLVQLSSGSKDSYILSNDKFIDYKAYEVIANRRIINHVIVNTSILVPSLNLNIKYQ